MCSYRPVCANKSDYCTDTEGSAGTPVYWETNRTVAIAGFLAEPTQMSPIERASLYLRSGLLAQSE
jgi:hypothetical protein